MDPSSLFLFDLVSSSEDDSGSECDMRITVSTGTKTERNGLKITLKKKYHHHHPHSLDSDPTVVPLVTFEVRHPKNGSGYYQSRYERWVGMNKH